MAFNKKWWEKNQYDNPNAESVTKKFFSGTGKEYADLAMKINSGDCESDNCETEMAQLQVLEGYPEATADFIGDLNSFGNNNFSIELDDLNNVLNWIISNTDFNQQINKNRINLFGHSRGGGITLLRSAQDKRIKNTITWASVCDFEARFPLDVSEWKETGVLEGSHKITAFTKDGKIHPEFPKKFFDLITDIDTPILLYCRTGNRTGVLGKALIDQIGQTNVNHLSDGIVGWKKQGLPVVEYKTE